MNVIMMASLDAIIDGVGNAVGWILISLLGGGLWLVRQTVSNKRSIDDLKDETELDKDPTRLESHEVRMEQQQENIAELKEYFVGDADDPNNPGLLSEIHDIKQSVDESADSDDGGAD